MFFYESINNSLDHHKMVKFFIKPYNKRAESKDDLRYAVIRQEGSSKRILQQDFLTEEGANDWLKQYHLKKEKKQGYNPTKSAEHRRNLARMHDSRRIKRQCHHHLHKI